MALATEVIECLIVGGGPAGLAAALCLSRARRTVVLFDSGKYRNAGVKHMHNVSTWDHTNPADYRKSARAELTEGRYKNVKIADVEIKNIVKQEDGLFEATSAAGEKWRGKTVVLATGVTDAVPDIPGYEDLWLNGNIYHCLFCHGFEDSGKSSAGVLATHGMTSKAFPANMVANLATQFVDNVIIYTNQGSKELLEELTALLKGKRNIKIDDKAIKMLKTSSAGPQVVLEDGEVDTHAFLAHAPNCAANAGFATSLGLELSESGGEIKVTPPFYKTNVPGVFAVGDVASLIKAVSIATAAGSLAGVGVSAHLLGL